MMTISIRTGGARIASSSDTTMVTARGPSIKHRLLRLSSMIHAHTVQSKLELKHMSLATQDPLRSPDMHCVLTLSEQSFTPRVRFPVEPLACDNTY